MRFGFLLRRGKPEARTLAVELAGIVVACGARAFAVDDPQTAFAGGEPVPAAELGRAIDVLVVLGGDGTFLYGASLVADDGVPLLGINLGNLGFMTHYALSEARTAVEAAAQKRLPIDERMRLRVGLIKEGREVGFQHALNEAALTQRHQGRLLDLDAHLDGARVTTYKADGLIVSTPTGSTAYNLAAGGPILTPDVEAIVLTPICPHTLTNRPVVMPARGIVTVRNVSAGDVAVTIDGHFDHSLAPGDAVEVRRAERPLRTFRPRSDFFAVLREKLSWGERKA